jgi:leader peptidase (prepilin peptidase) / N-methyltransferase
MPPTTSRLVSRPALTGIAFGVSMLLWVVFGSGWTLVALIPWSLGLLVLGVTDLEQQLVPKRLTYLTGGTTLSALAVAAAASDDWTRLGVAELCAFGATGLYGLTWLVFPKSLGFGDVRLVALASIMLGWIHPILVVVGLFVGQLSCLGFVAILAAAKRVNRKTEIPIGAFIAAASITTAIAFGR